MANDKDYPFSNEQIDSLRVKAASLSDNQDKAALYHFALSQIYHRRKEYDDAFKHLALGNGLVDDEITWSDTDEQNLFSSLKQTFNSSYIEQLTTHGSDNDTPIFIVGMPRSGTTLVEQIISSHPDAEGAGELTAVGDFAQSLNKTKGKLESIPPKQVHNFVQSYINHLSKIAEGKTRYTDKMPDNYLYLGLIAGLFPKARIIHCKRNPIATCFSIFQQKFKGHHPYAYNLEKLGQRYLAYQDLMEHWQEVLHLPVLDVCYEDMIADQEGQSRKILDFCGLDWTDNVLAYHKTQRKVHTASQWQVRQPIYTSSVEGWKHYEKLLEPLQARLEG